MVININLHENTRSLLAQFIASCAKICTLLLSGLGMSIPTIAIPVLLTDDDSDLHLTHFQASWFASMFPLFLVIGTNLSGCMAAYMGRKRSMLTATLPHMLGLALLYFSSNLPMAFVAVSLLGFGMGLGESSISTYVSETSEPKYRGMLLAISSVMVVLGSLIVFALGSLFQWRNVVLIIMIMPYLTVLVIAFVPEAPLWLLAKNRKDDAQAALQWLRGWTTAERVNGELLEMQQQIDLSTKCKLCEKDAASCHHPKPNFLRKFQDLFERQNRSVFLVIIMLFFISHFSGAFPMRAFLIQILEAYGVSMDANLATVVIGLASVIGKILAVVAIKLWGKRIVGLAALTTTFLSLVGLAAYAEYQLPTNWTSFRLNFDVVADSSLIPLVLFALYYFAHNGGIESMPFIALCEMFPFKNRCISTSISIALGQLIQFVTTKCYIYLELGLALSGTMWFFAAVCAVGFMLVYFFMPETEGVSMQHIELFFSHEKRKLTDVDIKEFIEKVDEKDVEISKL